MFTETVATSVAFRLRLLIGLFVVWSSLFLRLAADDSHTVVYAVIGKTARLTCPLPRLAAPRIDWFDLVYNTDPRPKRIFSNAAGSGSIEVSHPNRVNYDVDANFTLSIRDVRLEDAGAYRCTSRQTNYTLTKSYYLAVSGYPHCNGTSHALVGHTGHYSCESSFSGNYQPYLEWQRDREHTWQSVDNFDVRLAKKVFDVEVSEGDDGSTFTCRMTFGSIKEECHINLTVFYPVRDLVIDPIKDSFSVGEELRCSANGSPAPEISVKPALTPKTSGVGWRSFTIPRSFRGQELTVECDASNMVDGTLEMISKAISFSVKSDDSVSRKDDGEEDNPNLAQSTTSSSSGAIIGGIVVGLMILVVIVAIVFCVRLRKDKKPAKEENGGAKTPPSSGRDETQTQIKENQV